MRGNSWASNLLMMESFGEYADGSCGPSVTSCDSQDVV